MTVKLLFDTLSYATLLKAGGIEKPDVHATSLSQLLAYNIYTKDEIDMRFEQLINRSDAKLEKSLNEVRAEMNGMRADMHAIELRFEKSMNRYLITTISVLGSLIVIVGAISTFAHTLFN